MKHRCILLTSAAILLAISCADPNQEDPVKPEIKIPAESQAVFSVGISFPENGGTSAQTSTLSFTATEAWSTDVTDTKVSAWLSVSPSSGAAGTVNMTVTAQPNPGESSRVARVTIRCGSDSKSFTVTQAGNPPAVIPVTSVTLDKASLNLEEGETAVLTATVLPSDATDQSISWSTNDASVATVENGKVTAVAVGSAAITALAGGKVASCVVTVSKKTIKVSSVILNQTSLVLTKGQTETLVAIVKPDDATDKTVSWSSSATDVVGVDENGLVTALQGGEAVVTAKAGEISATCQVTVTVPVENVEMDRTSVTLEEGESTTLVATVKPDDATDKNVTWSTNDASVATVENGLVTGISEGTAVISALSGGKVGSCIVTVKKKVIAVTSVTLNKSTLALKKGQSETLSATVKPDDATDKTITWNSSAADVASVDASGKVTALRSGEALITAKAGEISAVCIVTVTVPVESVALDRTNVTLEEGQSTTLTVTISPNDADEKTVTWSSSDISVATVSGGIVTAIKEGETTITASVGDKSATCKVLVQKKVVAVTSVTLNITSLELEIGQSETLIATVKPDDATDKSVTWSSSDATVVRVEQNGNVTALKSGVVSIIAKAGEISATCKVTVKYNPSGGNEDVGNGDDINW